MMENSFDLMDLPTDDDSDAWTLHKVLNVLVSNLTEEGYELAYLVGISVQGVNEAGEVMQAWFDSASFSVELEQL